MRTRVKICGITQTEDALACVAHGVDALGFVFYEASPRFVEIEKTQEIVNKLPPFINKVALFVNANTKIVERHLKSLSIDVLQFHGDEEEAFCNSFGKPYIKAIRVQQDTNIMAFAEQYDTASGLLLDAFDAKQYGGTGQTLDWSVLPKNCHLPLILAGGLSDKNVAEAIHATHPYAVDVSSGVEASKGIKDHQLIKQFLQEVRRVG
jgi:phosphoribosylanthranilate isomerase